MEASTAAPHDYDALSREFQLAAADIRELHAAFDAGDADGSATLDAQEIEAVLACDPSSRMLRDHRAYRFSLWLLVQENAACTGHVLKHTFDLSTPRSPTLHACRLANVTLSASDIEDKLQQHASPGAAGLDFRAFLRLCCSLAERVVPGLDGALALLQKRPPQRTPTDVQRLSRCARGSLRDVTRGMGCMAPPLLMPGCGRRRVAMRLRDHRRQHPNYSVDAVFVGTRVPDCVQGALGASPPPERAGFCGDTLRTSQA